jgi:para-aminobenzoate synthetase/4-amino-4-deoxychorismate lyase
VELGRLGTPQDVLRALRTGERPFLLVGDWAGGGALAGADPVSDGELWVGVLGFGLGAEIERLPPPPRRPVPRPLTEGARYDHWLRMDGDGAWTFEGDPQRLAGVRERLATIPERRPWRLRGMEPAPPGHDGHRWAVADAVRRIAEGELFQASLCLRLEGELEGDPLDAFADASERLRPAMGAFVTAADGGAVLSFSPELFLRREGRRVWSSPIKGTAPGDSDPELLRRSAKDAAEHVMIVDLMRNDLGRVARYGTVTADPEPEVQAHPGLWHLVSTVRAELRDDADDRALVRAAFPPGSVTGAPKVQALHVIHALEGTGREAYTGAIGFASPDLGLQLNVAIRTVEVAPDGRAWLGCGGGIVADSDPDAELREALGKARPLVQALGGTVAAPAPWRRRRVPPLLAGPRPDPAAGRLETVRVLDGEPQHVDRHLRRLGRPDLEARVRAAAAAAGPGLHRLRIVGEAIEVTPEGDAPLWIPPLPAVCIPGGLGPHKWADRRPLTEHRLVVDADGAVLETTRASVWLVEGDTLVTPPADGRILPGITRERILEGGGLLGREVRVEPLDLDRYDRADAVLLTSAIRIVTAVGEAGTELAAELRSAATAPSWTA